jgi:endonuclease YncB( thermonuclease family)
LVTLAPVRGQRDFTIAPVREGPCRVLRVLEGNTLLVVPDGQTREVTIKLLSAQAPQVDADGLALVVAARRFTAEFVARGPVDLRLDNHRLDAQGNYLAYVECGGAQLNEALVAAGLARFYFFPGNSASTDRRLQDAEEAAQAARLGIWNDGYLSKSRD